MKNPSLKTNLVERFLKKKTRGVLPWTFALVLGLVGSIATIGQEVPKAPTPPPAGPETPSAAPAAAATGGETAAPPKPKKTAALTFNNDDLRVVLQAMARQARMSLILPEDIKGTVTARLEDVPVERAMRTILESKGFSLIELDGIWTVKSKSAIEAEPTKSEVFQFTNSTAKDTKTTVEKLLSKAPGANVQIDDRSNTLVITDAPSNLSKILPILKTLDTPTPQVLIETRLLEMTRNPQESIGVNWQSLASYQVNLATPTTALAGSGTANTSSGRLVGGITRSGDAGAIGAANAGRAGGIFTLVGAAGYPFGAVVDAPQFSTIFSFLMQDSDTELLASPKVITTDNKEAEVTIATREPIPRFTFNPQTASFGIDGFDFIPVGNVLKVTPHVNKDKFITMDVTPSVSTSAPNGRTFLLPGGSVTIPLISVRTLTTKVMVKSGNTLALGGLLEGNSTRAYSKVPFLGDIPFLGSIFRHRSYSKQKRNLLIFITPTVVGADTGTGLEDQYGQLKEMDENDRFAYKKSIFGNAKPRDQFRASDEAEVATSFSEDPHADNKRMSSKATLVKIDAETQETLVQVSLFLKEAERLYANNDFQAVLAICQDVEKKLQGIPGRSRELSRVRQYQSLCLTHLAQQAYDQKSTALAADLAHKAYLIDPKNRDAFALYQRAAKAGGIATDTSTPPPAGPPEETYPEIELRPSVESPSTEPAPAPPPTETEKPAPAPTATEGSAPAPTATEGSAPPPAEKEKSDEEKKDEAEKAAALEKAAEDKETGSKLNQDQLAPRVAPSLRE